MILKAGNWANHSFTQNYILRRPLAGAAILAFFSFCFALIYKPLGAHPGLFLGYELTMAVYIGIAALVFWIFATGLKSTHYYANPRHWTLFKELSAILIVLFAMGCAVYFTGFLMEPQIDRWNLFTFYDSVKKAMLLFVIPFGFFTALNFRFWDVQFARNDASLNADNKIAEELISISSQLKKETLSFYPSELLYATSDSNYVIFFLMRKGVLEKKMIRNSISNIEEQLSHLPQMIRIHRAFIVNIHKVLSKKGNSLGLRLKLSGIDEEIPVSRNKTEAFNKAFNILK